MLPLACVVDGDDSLWVASLGAPRTVAARSVLCARVDADGACRGQTAWSLPSAPLTLTAAAPAGAPHALALTADAHAWLLPLRPLPAAVAGAKRAAERGASEGPVSAPAVTPETHAQRDSASAGTPGCGWHRVAGDSGDDARDGEAAVRAAWPFALVPGACVAAAAGDVAMICRAGASPLALRLPARPPLPGELAWLPTPADDDANDAWAPSCAALLARAGCTDDDCVTRGWATLSPALCVALQLPWAGLNRGRRQLSACGCMRWALEGGACGTVRSHALSDAEASAEEPAVADPGALHTLHVRTASRALFHLHQRVVALLPAPSGQAVVLVGARGRIVAARTSDADSLHCREWRAPCGRVDDAVLLPDEALALLCDGGTATLVSSPLPGGTPAELSWRRVLDADAQPSRGIAVAPPSAGSPLLILRADGDVVAAALERAGPEASPSAGDDGDEAAHISESLRALAACDAAREELRPRAARADAGVAELSAVLPAAAVLAAAAVQARPAAAPLRCVLLDVVDDAYGDDGQFNIGLDVLNDTPRALSAHWSVLAVARCGERSAFASAPLRNGVPAGASVRVALPFPADLRPDAGAVCVDAWLLFNSPSATTEPACFPAGAVMRDVLHMATPCGDSEAGMALPPAAQPALPPMTLRLRVPPACVAARDVIAYVAGATCVAPARDGAGARAVASLPRGTSLRASAARAGVAEIALAATHAPTTSRAAAIMPLAQEALLRRALRQSPPPAADGGIDDDALTALRALRSRLVLCQDSLDAVMHMRAQADAPPTLHSAAEAAAAELCAVYVALRGAPFNAHAAC